MLGAVLLQATGRRDLHGAQPSKSEKHLGRAMDLGLLLEVDIGQKKCQGLTDIDLLAVSSRHDAFLTSASDSAA